MEPGLDYNLRRKYTTDWARCSQTHCCRSDYHWFWNKYFQLPVYLCSVSF